MQLITRAAIFAHTHATTSSRLLQKGLRTPASHRNVSLAFAERWQASGSTVRLYSCGSSGVIGSSTSYKGGSEDVRRLMRHVAHPVTIVTASPKAESRPSQNPRHWRGATVSSFVSVALSPRPVVSFNIRRDSSTFKALSSSGTFNVHVMASSNAAKQIAAKFAGGNALEPFHDGDGELEWWVRKPDPNDDGHAVIENAVVGSATSQHTESPVLFRLTCSHMDDKTVVIGDHVVAFGEVIEANETAQQGSDSEKVCLLYFHGQYGRPQQYSGDG
jgi:flavin reductase (DIM6/NTAB) family NADH-FMN oxidoreductase RutF